MISTPAHLQLYFPPDFFKNKNIITLTFILKGQSHRKLVMRNPLPGVVVG